MRIGRLLLGVALGLPMLAHADEDWLVGEYELTVPDHPAPSRYVVVIERNAAGRYRDDVFRRSRDAAAGLTPVDRPHDPKLAGVHVLSDADMASLKEPRLVLAGVRCAAVDGLMLCFVPDGQHLDLDGMILGPGYFAGGMEVGPIEVHERLPGRP